MATSELGDSKHLRITRSERAVPRRYITRPALATGRLAITPQGRVCYTLKTPDRDGTTHVVFAPLEFMARLAALVPRPRVHLTRYQGGVRAAQPVAARRPPTRGRRPSVIARWVGSSA